jgi:hypothetical protein
MYTSTLTQEDKQKYNIVVRNSEPIMFQAYFRLYKKLEDATMHGDSLERNTLVADLDILTNELFDLGYLMTNTNKKLFFGRKMFVSKMVTDNTGAFRCIDVGYVW